MNHFIESWESGINLTTSAADSEPVQIIEIGLKIFPVDGNLF
jgi:hypothetical protein